MSDDRYRMAAQVIELLEPTLTADGFELLDVRVFRGGGRLTVRISLDHSDGMNLDACTRAARTVNMLMEEADPFPDAYVIEVSSPGVRRPLRTEAHFAAAVGQDVILKFWGGDRLRTVKGSLRTMSDGMLTIELREGEGPLDVALDDVREANLDPEFDAGALIREDRRRKKDERKQKRSARRGGKEA